MDSVNLKIAIIIPAYNEEKTIKNVIQNCLNYGDIIVIDDNSNDNTSNIAKSFNIKVINNKKNLGYDKSIEIGIRQSILDGYDVALTFDADGEHPHKSIFQMLNILKKGFDIVVGVRNKKNRLIEAIFSFYSKFFWGLDDPLCGMKLYKLSSVKTIDAINTYESIGTELTFKLINRGFKLAQLDIKVDKRVGNSRIGNIFKANLKILKSMLYSPLIKFY